MIPIQKVLVPVDFSEASRKAVSYGLTLADRFNARLILAHIVPESPALTYAFPTEIPLVEKQQFEKAKQEIEKLVPPEPAARLNLRTVVKVGAVEAELLGIVQDEAADLVIMGTHGRHAPRRWFIGSVTEHMLRRVPVPILTMSHVEAGKHAIGLTSLKRILYATDLAEASPHAYQYAVELARGTGAHLTVMHVMDYDDRVLWGPALIAYLDRAKLAEEHRGKLDGFVAQERTAGVEIETLLTEGKPFRKILDSAEERNTDLIVLSLQSRGLLERAFIGSTAERVVRLASIPVLSIPVPAPAKA